MTRKTAKITAIILSASIALCLANLIRHAIRGNTSGVIIIAATIAITTLWLVLVLRSGKTPRR